MEKEMKSSYSIRLCSEQYFHAHGAQNYWWCLTPNGDVPHGGWRPGGRHDQANCSSLRAGNQYMKMMNLRGNKIPERTGAKSCKQGRRGPGGGLPGSCGKAFSAFSGPCLHSDLLNTLTVESSYDCSLHSSSVTSKPGHWPRGPWIRTHPRGLSQAPCHLGSVGCWLHPFWILWRPVLPARSLVRALTEDELWPLGPWPGDYQPPVNLGSLHNFSSFWDSFLGGIFRNRHDTDRNRSGGVAGFCVIRSQFLTPC